MRFHMGCGDVRLDGYVNLDVRETPAADVVCDLTEPELPEGEVEGVFSHAFFEHLRRDARARHLRALRVALGSSGFVCYVGLPDFRRVAELYLAGGPGVVGPRFDLFNVYRYTHGDPEMASGEGWHAQLHKSLFDVEELDLLLREAGFASYVVFRYVHPGDPPATDLSLGFYAVAVRTAPAQLRERARRFLAEHDRLVAPGTIRFEDGVSRARPLAVAAALPMRRLVRRAAYGSASVLARRASADGVAGRLAWRVAGVLARRTHPI